jgi:flagellar assembly factor FliW
MNTPSTAENVVTFPDGLPGFESTRRFVLVTSAGLDPFTLVRGLESGAPAFVAIEPRQVDAAYDASMDEANRTRLGAGAADTLLWLALVTVAPDGAATVNLRAPIVINPHTMLGLQMVVADSPYPLDYPLLAA